MSTTKELRALLDSHGVEVRLHKPVTKAELARENAKLRELVRAAWKCIHSGLSCSGCRFVAGGCTLESAMRELGIEVDGDA